MRVDSLRAWRTSRDSGGPPGPRSGPGWSWSACWCSPQPSDGPLALPADGGAAWLPPDGHRQRFAGPDGVHVTEWAFDQTLSLLGQRARHLRELDAGDQDRPVGGTPSPGSAPCDLNGSGEVVVRTDDLFSLGSDGVRAEVVSGLDGSTPHLPTRAARPARQPRRRAHLDLGGCRTGHRRRRQPDDATATAPSTPPRRRRTRHCWRAPASWSPCANRSGPNRRHQRTHLVPPRRVHRLQRRERTLAGHRDRRRHPCRPTHRSTGRPPTGSPSSSRRVNRHRHGRQHPRHPRRPARHPARRHRLSPPARRSRT